MEAEEIREFVEEQEKGSETRQYAVSFSISVLAVLVALATVLGHRAHTEAVLQQARASDVWNLYQAKKIRDNQIAETSDLLTILAPNNTAAAATLAGYQAHRKQWAEDLKKSQEQAHDLESEVAVAERKAVRFDLGEALLQIAVVLASVTLLTRQRIYWMMGLAMGTAGLVIAVTGFVVH